jgi:hypothetical protein
MEQLGIVVLASWLAGIVAFFEGSWRISKALLKLRESRRSTDSIIGGEFLVCYHMRMHESKPGVRSGECLL